MLETRKAMIPTGMVTKQCGRLQPIC
jgi:hypothetical protein